MTKLFNLLSPDVQKLFNPTRGDGMLSPGEICRYRFHKRPQGVYSVYEEKIGLAEHPVAFSGFHLPQHLMDHPMNKPTFLYPEEFHLKVKQTTTVKALATATRRRYEKIIQDLLAMTGPGYQLYQRVRHDFEPEKTVTTFQDGSKESRWFCWPLVCLAALPAEEDVHLDTFARVG